MLAGTIVFESVKTVAGWVTEIVERASAIEQLQLYQGTILHLIRQSSTRVTAPDELGFFISEAADHRYGLLSSIS
jgi:hypothetical protein